MTKDTKDKLILAGLLVSIVGVLWVAGYTRDKRDQRVRAAQEARKETVCPSFLSIARSARDTLIVMRNEELCNRYVLDNLK